MSKRLLAIAGYTMDAQTEAYFALLCDAAGFGNYLAKNKLITKRQKTAKTKAFATLLGKVSSEVVVQKPQQDGAQVVNKDIPSQGDDQGGDNLDVTPPVPEIKPSTQEGTTVNTPSTKVVAAA